VGRKRRAGDPGEPNFMHFSDLNLIEPLLRAVATEGYDAPTPIQQQAIPHVLAGRDLLGCAQTGTGKTAAFALPILQRLAAAAPPAPEGGPAPRPGASRGGPIRVLVLTPTRELAAQIGDSFATYGRNLRLRHTVIFGGVGQRAQEQALAQRPDILVATPGRLLDLAQQGHVNFRGLEIFVLDEADRMLDMGFIHDVRRVIALLPARRQTLFFSATMPPDIIELSSRILTDPARVSVSPVTATADNIRQHVYFVAKGDKRALLEHVLGDPAIERAIVFTRTKHGANRVAEHLAKARIDAAAIHGNKSQNARERALAGFKRGDTRVLVATDIAARGIDVDGISHVINFDLPDVPESYVHRIGRTARAGASGVAFSFCDRGEELAMLTAIERLIRARIPVVEDHPMRGARSGAASPPREAPREAPRGDSRFEAPRRFDGPRAPRPAQPVQGAPVHAERAGGVPAAAPAGGPSRRFSGRSTRRYVTS
jgi:ATP-dependent RNA helicase RhlE